MSVKWICEIGSNHNQDIVRIIDLIGTAKTIGCDAVKFQYFQADQLYAPQFKERIIEMKQWELPFKFIPEIVSYCKTLDLKFGCSVFHLEAVQSLERFVDFFKIGSYELLWTPLIQAVAKTGRSWMMSTGMENLSSKANDPIQMAQAIGWMSNYNIPCTIFHCNGNYPAQPNNCNLNEIAKLKKHFYDNHGDHLKIGWSDHTTEPGVIYKAIELGAEVIEFHLDLNDGLGNESQIGNSNHCWPPYKIKKVIDNIKIGEIAEFTSDSREDEAKKWRTDPEDGLRPLKEFRKELLK